MHRIPLIDIDLPKPSLLMRNVFTSLLQTLSIKKKTKVVNLEKIHALHKIIVDRYRKAESDPFGKNRQIYESSKTILDLIELIEINLKAV